MPFIKDEDLQIKLEKSPTNRMIQIFARDRSTKQEVRLGHVQGNQHLNKEGKWIEDAPDEFAAKKIREMVRRLLKDTEDLT
jgi:hypothetical protein